MVPQPRILQDQLYRGKAFNTHYTVVKSVSLLSVREHVGLEVEH